MPHLYRLVYYSNNHVIGKPPEVADAIASILATSRVNNARADITGALIFNHGIFAQVLEGELPDVEATFERIQRDPRHGEVQILAFEPAPCRGFPSWSMGYVGDSREDVELFSGIAAITGFDARRMQGERVFEIMHAIALEEQARAA
ncbi:MAG: BLUF domain-containing protein [Tardiphaga sp.]|nr:BLUF domain-containing protein [Tardiphaga sp.]